jgi:hypothetical protein
VPCRSIAVLALALPAGCGPGPRDTAADATGSGGADAGPDAIDVDAGPAPFMGAIYAHSYQNLYRVDPDTLAVTLVGPFGWPQGEDLMTDIAVDADGNITGISFGAVFAVDRDTAQCTYLSALGGSFNGLSFLPRQSGGEILIGTTETGEVWEIDRATGSSTMIGDYGGVVGSSGDIVSVTGFGTVATVKFGGQIDYLARIDETTGAATLIGQTGYADIWGIGFWRNRVYGFVATNQFVLIDVTTGVATYVSTGPENWAGAGVTTSAPVVE